jgi:hypothetical protein
MKIRIDLEDGGVAVPVQELPERPRPGDVVRWGDGNYVVAEGPAEFARADVLNGRGGFWYIAVKARKVAE